MTSPSPLLHASPGTVILDVCRPGLTALFDTVAYGTSFQTWGFGKEYDQPMCWVYESPATELRQFNDADGDTVLEIRPVRAGGERARWSADDCDATDGPRIIGDEEASAFTAFTIQLAVACLLMKHGLPVAEWLCLGGDCPSLPGESANIARLWMGEDA